MRVLSAAARPGPLQMTRRMAVGRMGKRFGPRQDRKYPLPGQNNEKLMKKSNDKKKKQICIDKDCQMKLSQKKISFRRTYAKRLSQDPALVKDELSPPHMAGLWTECGLTRSRSASRSESLPAPPGSGLSVRKACFRRIHGKQKADLDEETSGSDA